MSDETPTPEEETPKTAAEASGSVFKRLQHPVSTSGEARSRGTSASAREIKGEVLRRSNMAPDVPAAVRPRRKVGPVSETMVGWLAGIGVLVIVTIWIGARA